MKKLSKKIKLWLSRRAVNKSIHYENIKNGESLIVDGKKYVKVKLKFVDSLQYKAAKRMDTLESEAKILYRMVKDLKEKLSAAEIKIDCMQVLNINLAKGNRAKRDENSLNHQKLIHQIKQLKIKNKEQKLQLQEMEKLNRELNDDIREQTEEFERLKNKILQLPIQYETGDTRELRQRINETINGLTIDMNSLQDIIVLHENLNRKMLEDLRKDEW
ncbi:hypothetical protein [Marinifilum sp. D737]|uniref:hypothetical protein n=1 Tax=Marinifilum sp. D737 TaxID=2969628 RepID=UPI00227267A1|nr:hypothetical protein [Marinifilum sp. D737]MCY1633554.1 hypothetical protein [Marinifilum sp. D737]